MEPIKEIRGGTFFVPSYSIQTVLSFQHGITNQTVLMQTSLDRPEFEVEQPGSETPIQDQPTGSENV